MPERPEDIALEMATRRWMQAGLVLMVLLSVIFPIFRWYEPAQRADAREEHTAFLATQGAEIFDVNCSSCHGPDGRGGLAPALAAREFLESVNDIQIEQLTALGVPGSEMVAYSSDLGGPLTSQQIRAITTYLRSLEEDSVANANWRTPLANEDLSGRDLYNLACSRCHAVDLTGIEEIAPPLGAGSEATEDSDVRIAKRIREGEDEMPRFGNVLNDEQIAKLVEYIRQIQDEG